MSRRPTAVGLALANSGGLHAFAQQPVRLRPRDVDALPAKPADVRMAYSKDDLQFGELRLPKGRARHRAPSS